MRHSEARNLPPSEMHETPQALPEATESVFVSPENAAERAETPKERVASVLETLEQAREQAEKRGEFPKATLLVGSDKIENQEVTFVNRPKELSVSFMLNPEQHKSVSAKFEAMLAKSDQITVPSADGKRVRLADALAIKHDDLTVKVGQETETLGARFGAMGAGSIRVTETARRMATIEIAKKEGGISREKMAALVQEAMQDFFEIPEGLSVPETESERSLMLQQYAEHHKIDAGTLSNEEQAAIAERLVREEVFPGRHATVEKGKHKEYEKTAPYALFHNLWGQNVERDSKRMVQLVTGPGLMSRLERYQRGVEKKPLMESPDMAVGSGDQVFTRMVTEDGGKKGYDRAFYGYTVVLAPELMDRTDAYAYRADQFGNKSDSSFAGRIAPEKFMEKEAKKHSYDNEVMFQGGIPKEQFKAVACGTEKARDALLAAFKENGITEINGFPVEEFVVVTKKRSEWVGLAKREPNAAKEPNA